MRATLEARVRALSGLVERAMVGEPDACASPVALADWVAEECRAIAEEHGRDEWAAGYGHPETSMLSRQPS